MKVCIYRGSFSVVAKSGVGQAVLHQTAMLQSLGIEVTEHPGREADVVHFNTVFPDSFFAALCARLRGQRVVYYGHSTMEDFRNSFRGSNLLAPLFRRWICRCYSLGDVIITPTEYSKRLLLSYGIKKPIYALSNGIDTEFFAYNAQYRAAFRQKYGLAQGEKAVLSVGHYIERKGILDFIALARALPDVRFFWFGHTNLRLVPAAVRKAIEAAPPNCVFPGYVDRQALRAAYCGCDAFCFMSHEETEGIVVLEALACGIPTIVRDIPVYGGWLRQGENVYKAADNDAFCRLTQGVLTGRLPSLAAPARALAESRSIARTAKRLQKIYAALEAPKAPAPQPAQLYIG